MILLAAPLIAAQREAIPYRGRTTVSQDDEIITVNDDVTLAMAQDGTNLFGVRSLDAGYFIASIIYRPNGENGAEAVFALHRITHLEVSLDPDNSGWQQALAIDGDGAAGAVVELEHPSRLENKSYPLFAPLQPFPLRQKKGTMDFALKQSLQDILLSSRTNK